MHWIFGIFEAFIFVFPAYLISLAIDGSKKKQEDLWIRASKEKHRVRAVLKWKSRSYRTDSVDSRSRNCLYEYDWQGKTYRRFCVKGEYPPDAETLYFIKSPRKAAPQGEIKSEKVNWLALGVCLAIVLSLLMSQA